jgi:hypothetical protein
MICTNPTRVILDALPDNDVQRGIKAVLLVQTRDARTGASPGLCLDGARMRKAMCSRCTPQRSMATALTTA